MESHTRTLMKTLSWRLIAAVVTGLLGWVLTGSPTAGLALGAGDTLIKLFLYYAHERVWAQVDLGYRQNYRRLTSHIQLSRGGRPRSGMQATGLGPGAKLQRCLGHFAHRKGPLSRGPEASRK